VNRASAMLVAGLALGIAPDSTGATWTESGDAGDLPGTAQATVGSGALDAIEGSILDEADQDMFLVLIEDPEAFSASTNNAGTNLELDNDTQLFLFDAQGFGVLANDDDPDDFLTFLSTTPAGSLNGPAGTYLLAVSIFDNDPISVGGEIFPDEPADDVVGPTGPGGVGPVSAWDVDPVPPDSGPYRIELTGVTFAPEPAKTVTWTLGAVLALSWFKRPGCIGARQPVERGEPCAGRFD